MVLISGDNLIGLGSDGYSFLSQQGFGGGPNDIDQDPGGFIGINLGNSGDTKKLESNVAAINLAHDLDISWGRASGGPQQWNAFGSLSPENFDAVVNYANSKDVNIYLYLEYRTDIDGGSIFDFDWYEVGRTYAQHFGDRVKAYGIINEPDHIVSENSPQQIAFAVEEFADGVHSVNPNYIVTSPGLGGTPISIERTNDFLEALAPLFNDNTLQVLNLHSYHDSRSTPHFSSIDDSSDWAPSRNFIRAKTVGGITANVGFMAGEFNYRNWEGTDEERGIGFLTTLWDQLSVVGNEGINDRVGLFSAPFTITGSAQRQTSIADFYSFDNIGNYTWQPNEKGQVLETVLTLTQGMNFIHTDPLDKGLVILRGNDRKMWVWDNREDFSSLTDAPIISISGIPSDATALAIYRWDSTANEPYGFIELNGQTSISFEVSSLLPFGQTYMLLANSDNDGGNIGSIDAAEINGIENNSPIANNDVVTTTVDTELTIDISDLLANDVDVDGDNFTISGVNNVVNGTVTLGVNSVTFAPNAGFEGNASFEYTISDGNDGTDAALVTVIVETITDQTINGSKYNDDLTGGEGNDIIYGEWGNDTLCGGNGEDSLNGNQDHDLLKGNNGNDTLIGAYGNDTLDGGEGNDILNGNQGDDTLNGGHGNDTLNGGHGNDTFVLAVGEGADTIINFSTGDLIHLTDGLTFDDLSFAGSDIILGTEILVTLPGINTATLTEANFSIIVNSANNPPNAVDDSDTTDEDTWVTTSVLSNDTDPENNPLTVSSATNGSNGTTTVNSDGTITYTPNPDFNGTDTYTYEVSDGNGGTDTSTASITVNSVNDPPDAVDDSDTTNEDMPVTTSVLSNDTDPENNPLTVSSATNGSNGTTTVNSDGTITYTPNPGFNGIDTYTYEIDDGNGGTAQAIVNIDVAGIINNNNNPIANDDSFSTSVDTALSIPISDLLANDFDPDGDILIISIDGNAINSTVILEENNVIFSPDVGFDGTANFDYTISDGNGGTDTAVVSVTVEINDTEIVDQTINGTSKNDTLTGGSGNDIINGFNRNDLIEGEDGNDTLSGGGHNDIINGGNGNDVLMGDRGVDQLSGGAGADVFVYISLSDRGDTIFDFQIGEDIIDISSIIAGYSSTSNNPFVDYVKLVQSGSNTDVQISRNGNLNKPQFFVLATLIDVDMEVLNSDNFIV